jgi:hypothetical protein
MGYYINTDSTDDERRLRETFGDNFPWLVQLKDKFDLALPSHLVRRCSSLQKPSPAFRDGTTTCGSMSFRSVPPPRSCLTLWVPASYPPRSPKRPIFMPCADRWNQPRIHAYFSVNERLITQH